MTFFLKRGARGNSCPIALKGPADRKRRKIWNCCHFGGEKGVLKALKKRRGGKKGAYWAKKEGVTVARGCRKNAGALRFWGGDVPTSSGLERYGDKKTENPRPNC